MKERPSWPMKDYEVRAILDGIKTQTRRAVKPQPYQSEFEPGTLHINGVTKKKQVINGKVIPKGSQFSAATSIEEFSKRCPYGQVGDRLWVRENFSYDRLDIDRDGSLPTWYWADGNPKSGDWTKPKPSIHMPRWASRITLEITGVRVERLQDICEEDALAEGVLEEFGVIGVNGNGGRHNEVMGYRYFVDGGQDEGYESGFEAYNYLWQSINGAESWAANPWVWVVEFKRCD